ncbi:MAG: DUF4388 domain-containing protein [Cyanobacteria bacterium P01_A01_bin.123]
MEIRGHFSEFPLPELLQFLERLKTTGCLLLHISSNHYVELQPQCYVVWLDQGNIVSTHRKSHQQDVYTLAVQKEWVSPFVAKKLKARSPQGIAAGLYLESQGILSFEQLRLLFFSEVVHRVESLCDVRNATFEFRTTVALPMNEMTGFRIPATKLAAYGIQGCHINQFRGASKSRNRQPYPEKASYVLKGFA